MQGETGEADHVAQWCEGDSGDDAGTIKEHTSDSLCQPRVSTTCLFPTRSLVLCTYLQGILPNILLLLAYYQAFRYLREWATSPQREGIANHLTICFCSFISIISASCVCGVPIIKSARVSSSLAWPYVANTCCADFHPPSLATVTGSTPL